MSDVCPPFRPTSILVTGGAGFIGSHLVNALFDLTTDTKIVVVDRLDHCSRPKNWRSDVTQSPRFAFRCADITDFAAMIETLNTFQVDSVFHLAAETLVCNSWANSANHVNSNVLGTNNLCQAMREYGRIRRFVHVSTDEVIGSIPDDASSGCLEDAKMEPTNPYSSTKAAGEIIARSYGTSYHLPVICVRPCNQVGTGQHVSKSVPRFCTLLATGQKITIHGLGTAKRMFMHVDDLVRGLITVIEFGEIGSIYHIGTNNELSVMELATRLIRFYHGDDADINKHIEYVRDRNFQDTRYWIRSEKMHALGWQERVPFDTGLREIAKWYFDRVDEYRIGLVTAGPNSYRVLAPCQTTTTTTMTTTPIAKRLHSPPPLTMSEKSTPWSGGGSFVGTTRGLRVHGTLATLRAIIRRIECGLSGAYLRFGDGDVELANNRSELMQSASPQLATEMREAMALRHPDVLRTLPLYCRELGGLEPGMIPGNHAAPLDWCLNILRTAAPHWNTEPDGFGDVYSHVALSFAACTQPAAAIELLLLLQSQSVVLVGNRNVPEAMRIRLLGPAALFVPTPERASFSDMDRIESDTLRAITQLTTDKKSKYAVVVTAMGCSGRPLQKRLWRRLCAAHDDDDEKKSKSGLARGQRLFLFDFGSLLDALCGWDTRAWVKIAKFDAGHFLSALDLAVVKSKNTPMQSTTPFVSPNEGLVTARTVGGLGNQLFTLAAGLAYAMRTRRRFQCVRTEQSDSVFAPRPVYWSTLFRQLSATTTSFPSTTGGAVVHHDDHDPGFRKIPEYDKARHVVLRGYLQSPHYWADFQRPVMEALIPADLLRQAAALFPKRETNNEEGRSWAFVHFRRGDYSKIKFQSSTLVLGMDYYERAAARFPRRATSFLVFCESGEQPQIDRDLRASPVWNKLIWRFADASVPDWMQMLMMACCPAGGIIANSTFSVWAGYIRAFHPAVPDAIKVVRNGSDLPLSTVHVAPAAGSWKLAGDVDGRLDLVLPHWLEV